MTCEPCEGEEAGLSFVQQDPQRLHQRAAIGHWWIEPETWGPPRGKLTVKLARLGLSAYPAWPTAVTWLRSRANGLQRAAVGIASGRPEWETLRGRPQVGRRAEDLCL